MHTRNESYLETVTSELTTELTRRKLRWRAAKSCQRLAFNIESVWISRAKLSSMLIGLRGRHWVTCGHDFSHVKSVNLLVIKDNLRSNSDCQRILHIIKRDRSVDEAASVFEDHSPSWTAIRLSFLASTLFVLWDEFWKIAVEQRNSRA